MKIISVLSILIMILPFLGLPSSFKTILFVLFGGAIFLMSYFANRSYKQVSSKTEDVSFKQNDSNFEKNE